jgi:multidrug efflux system membrane fusion protein
MSSRGTEKSGFDTAADHARHYAEQTRGAVGRANDWSSRHLWGGAKTMWIGLGILLLALVLYLVYPTAQTKTRASGPMPVAVVTATNGDITVTLDALGTVTPLATVTVRPQVSGNLLKFYFQEGQIVKAGEVLAQIDPAPYQAALDQAKGALAKDEASLANAKLDLKRYQALFAQNATSQQTLATQQALVRSDEGVIVSDKANVETAAINLGYTRIVSPVSGRVGIRQVDIGNLIQAGQTTGIVVVTQLQPMSVLFSLPEDNIGDVMERVNAGATLEADAYDRDQTHKLATGTLSAVDSQIDTTTGTVKLRAMFANTDNALFPQQFVNVRLLVNTLHDQTIVPSSAIQRGAEGTYVYVVESDSTVTMRTVTLGVTENDRVAITQGLKPGDVVVVDGADRLRDGESVILPKGQTGTAATASSGNAGQPAASGTDERAQRRAKMAAIMKQYCSADIAKYCPNMQPGSPELRQCFFENRDSFSDTCRQQMAKLRHGGHHGGGGGGGFGGGGPQ